MAVAHDAVSESHTGTTGSVSQASFSWTHTPTGTPKGVLVFVFNTSAGTDIISSVTYGGAAVPAVAGAAAADTATEPGHCKVFFLGASVPTGAQSVVVNRTNNTNEVYAVAITVTAGTSVTTAAGVTLQQENQAPAEANVDDYSPGANSVRYAGAFYGGSGVPTAGANSTALISIDFGVRTVGVVRETTAGQGARPVGFSAASDDWACVLLAIRETGTIAKAVAGTLGFAAGGAGTPVVTLLYAAQSTGSYTTEAGSATFTLAGGETLVAGIAGFSTADVGAPSDSASALGSGKQTNAYNAFVDSAKTHGGFYAVANASSGSHTITPPAVGGGSDALVRLIKISGMPSTLSVRTYAKNQQLTASNSFSLTTVGDVKIGDIVIGMRWHENTVGSTDVITSPAGFTSLIQYLNGAVNLPTDFCYFIATSDGPLTATWTDIDPAISDTTGALLVLTPATSPEGLIKKALKALSGALSYVGSLATSFTGGGGTTYPQALTASLSFAGSLPKSAGKALSGALSFAGAIARSTARTFTASLPTSGALGKKTARALTASASFAGSAAKQTARPLTAAVSFVGSLSRAARKVVAASLTFAGATARAVSHVLTGQLSFSGALVALRSGGTQYLQALAGALSFSGAATKSTGKPVAGSLSFAGTVSKRIAHQLAAGLSFVGAVARLVKSTQASALSFAGNVQKRAARSLAGAVAFVGSLASARLFVVALTGSLSFSGGIGKGIGKAFDAALGFVGGWLGIGTGVDYTSAPSGAPQFELRNESGYRSPVISGTRPGNINTTRPANRGGRRT